MAHITHIHKYIQDLWSEVKSGGGAAAINAETNSLNEEGPEREEFTREKTPENVDDILEDVNKKPADPGNGNMKKKLGRSGAVSSAAGNSSSVVNHLLANSGKRGFFLSNAGVEWSAVPVVSDSKTSDEDSSAGFIDFGLIVGLDNEDSEFGPLQSWEMIFNDELIQKIVNFTNISIKAIKLTTQKPIDFTNKLEIRGLLSLIYFTGLFHFSRRNIEDFWDVDGTGVEVFRKVMNYKRFAFLLSCMEIDVARKQEQLEALEEVVTMFNANCQAIYTPSECLTVFEKPDVNNGENGTTWSGVGDIITSSNLRSTSLIDSKTFYTYNAQFEFLDQAEGPFRASESTNDIVLNLIKPISGERRSVTMTSNFTDCNLFLRLLYEHKLTAAGSIKPECIEIPKQFTAIKSREPLSSLFGFQRFMTLISFITKAKTNCLLLSTIHTKPTLVEDIHNTGLPQKPEAIEFFTVIKHCVDTVNKYWEQNSISKRLYKWNLPIIYQLLNTGAINAQIIYRSATDDEELKRGKFLKRVALDLINTSIPKNRPKRLKAPVLREKFQNLNFTINLRPPLPGRHDDVTDDPEEANDPLLGEEYTSTGRRKRGRCKVCLTTNNYERKTSRNCDLCHKWLCGEHSVMFCQKCSHGMVYK